MRLKEELAGTGGQAPSPAPPSLTPPPTGASSVGGDARGGRAGVRGRDAAQLWRVWHCRRLDSAPCGSATPLPRGARA